MSDMEDVPALAMPEPLNPGMRLLSPLAQRHFDVDAFLCSRTVGQDVHAIVKELRTYKHTVQESLVQVINDKYRDFVALSSMLQSEADDICALGDEGALHGVEVAIRGRHDALAHAASEIAALVHEEEALTQERRHLQSLLDIEQTVRSLTALLGIAQSEPAHTPSYRSALAAIAQCDLNVDDADADQASAPESHELPHFQRMIYAMQRYSALQHLLSTIDKEKAYRYLLQLEPILKDVYEHLLQDTMQLYVQSTREPPPQSRKTLALALDLSLELGASAVNTVMERITAQLIEPRIQAAFDAHSESRSTLALPFDAAETTRLADMTHLPWDAPRISPATADLRTTYCALLDATKELSDMFAVTEQVGGAMLDVFNQVWWQHVATTLEKARGSQLFFIGRANEFCMNYYLTQAFLREMELLAPSKRASTAFRAHAKTVALQQRWAFSAFFQLRAREIITALEQGLRAQKMSTSMNAAQFYHDGFAHLLYAFTSPWYMTRHFTALSAREWRLSLHVLSRYRTWLDAQCQVLVPPGTESGPESEAPSRTATPTLDEGGLAEADVRALHCAMALLVDIDTFENRVHNVLDTYIAPKVLGERGGALRDTLRKAADAALGATDAVRPQVAHYVIHKLCKRCAEPLRHVRASNSQYRPFARHAEHTDPERSAFVPLITKPLRQVFAPDAPSQHLPRDLLASWITQILDHTFARYTTAIDTITRNLESLRRLKRGTPGMGGDEAANKAVYTQVATDIASLTADIEAFAHDAKIPLTLTSQAYKGLQDVAKCP